MIQILNINDGKTDAFFTQNISVFNGHIFVANGDTFLESGRYIGTYSDIFLHIYPSDTMVYAIWFNFLFFNRL